jgi:hypothetical protein
VEADEPTQALVRAGQVALDGLAISVVPAKLDGIYPRDPEQAKQMSREAEFLARSTRRS